MKKINVNTESIISALFLLGFDTLDPYLITAVMANITIISREKQEVKIKLDEEYYSCQINFISDAEIYKPFQKLIDFNFITKLKEEINMDTDIANKLELNNIKYTFKEYISSLNNRLLARYIEENINFKEIIIKKIGIYQQINIEYLKEVFCDKERNIIMEILGIDDMFRKDFEHSSELNRKLCVQETNDIDNKVQTLERIRTRK